MPQMRTSDADAAAAWCSVEGDAGTEMSLSQAFILRGF